MSEKTQLQRLIVCVDGASGRGNLTGIARIARLVKEGPCLGPDGASIQQTLVYSQAAEEFTLHGRDVEAQIEFIVKNVGQVLNSPEDELYLYGSGNGAYIVRAVAGVLHHMGLPKSWSMVRFHENYVMALDLYKAKCEEDSTRGVKIMQTLKAHCHDPPVIKFVGVIDTMKKKADATLHDLSFNPSTHTMRHAMALNEDSADLVGVPVSNQKSDRSLLQAWFVGNNEDLCGGLQNDGLSLYPLQWMLIESIKAGLVLNVSTATTSDENPLALAFPKAGGALPTLGGQDPKEWVNKYTNGIEVSMFDLQPTHISSKSTIKSSHAVQLRGEGSYYNHPRKVFNTKGLIGWSEKASASTIVHPSVFCLLDRYPKIQTNSRLRSLKRGLADYQEYCMEPTKGLLPPWLEGMQLQASGVRAFRILVCGKTGVGKSTLINRVFGVEMTEESKSFAQGVHDINQAFESPSHPGLLIHDSRGWQSGSNQEVDLIAQFLKTRASQKDPAEALHVIWSVALLQTWAKLNEANRFCVDSDVSRIEEADRKTFEIITQYSHHVPIFIIGTKKDKIANFRKMQLLEKHLNSDTLTDVKELNKTVTQETEKQVSEHFADLISQFSSIAHYRADASLCLSKDDDDGIKDLLNQTIGLIADDRVRLFCVAAQVLSVDQKISSAISETMRLGAWAVKTVVVPLPFSGLVATPTVSRMICEHILQCFGFPKAAPDAIHEIMSQVVVGNLKPFMAVAIPQFLLSSGFGGFVFGAPPTARMLLKCACDMILILERSFRYGGKFVSVKQIEDAARYYTKATIKTFGGRDQLLQQRVHEAIDKMIPMSAIQMTWKFSKLRVGVEEIIYKNRFGRSPTSKSSTSDSIELSSATQIHEMSGEVSLPAELDGAQSPAPVAELEGDLANASMGARSDKSLETFSQSATTMSTASTYEVSDKSTIAGSSEAPSELDTVSSVTSRGKSDVSSLRSRFASKFTMRKNKTVK